MIGSEVSGGARYIFGENCEMDSPNLDRAIRVKTNRSRGGTIEHLYFRNIEVGEVKEAVVKVNMQYTLDDSISIFYPTVGHISVENVNSTSSKYGVMLVGYDEEDRISDVNVSNCRFAGVREGNLIEFVSDIHFEHLYINGELVVSPDSED